MAEAQTILRKPDAGKMAGNIKLKESDFSVGSQGKRPPQKMYKFRVDMWCEGCALDVKQALELAKNASVINDYSIDYSTKKVTITSSTKMDEVYAIMGKAGKSFTLEESKIMEVAKVRTK